MSEIVELYEPDYLSLPTATPAGGQGQAGEPCTENKGDGGVLARPLLTLVGDIFVPTIVLEKNFRFATPPYELSGDIENLYSLQNCLIDLDTITKKLAKIQVAIKQDYDSELQKKVDAGEFEYDEHIITPIIKKTNRSVDEDTLKQYYKPFFDSIIAAKTTVLEKTYKVSIKDVESFMGSLAEKVIRPGAEVIAWYEIQRKE